MPVQSDTIHGLQPSPASALRREVRQPSTAPSAARITRPANCSASPRSCRTAITAAPLPRLSAQQLHDLQLMIGIERRGRLVGQQQGRRLRQGSGHHHARPFALGQRVDPPRRQMFQFGRGDGPVDGGLDPRPSAGASAVRWGRRPSATMSRTSHGPMRDPPLRADSSPAARAGPARSRPIGAAVEPHGASRRSEAPPPRAESWSCRRRWGR